MRVGVGQRSAPTRPSSSQRFSMNLWLPSPWITPSFGRTDHSPLRTTGVVRVMQCSVVSLERATVSLVRWMERHHEQSTSIRALLLSPGLWGRWFPLLLPSAPTRCGGCHGVALSTGRYPTRRSVVAPRDEVKHPYAVACEARRWEGTHHQAGETAHACVAEASRSPSPSVSEADVWLSEAQRGCQARLSEGDPPRAARAPPPGIPLASVDLWPCATRFRALHMGEVVCAIPDLRAVGSALLRPRPRAVGSLGRAGHKEHSTVVHGCAIAHTAEAMPPRLPGHQRLTHEWSQRYACLRSGRRTGQCSL